MLEIRHYPDPILSTPAVDVDSAEIGTEDFQRRLDDMFDTMYEAAGIGLAAPQVGVGRRFFVINVAPETGADGELVFINPRLTMLSDEEQIGSEGCLSFPEIRGVVTRAMRCTVVALDRHGKEFSCDGEALMARAFQHEIGHLDGKLFFTRFSAADRAVNQRALNDLQHRWDRAQKSEAKRARRDAKRAARVKKLKPQRH